MLSLHLHTHSRLWLLPVTALTNTRQSPSWTLLWWIPSQLDMLAELNMELSAWADDVLIVLREARVLTSAFGGERNTNNKRKQYFTFHTIISDNNWVFFWLYVNYFLSAACSTLKCGVSVNSLLINSPKIWCASRSSTNFTCIMLLCSLCCFSSLFDGWSSGSDYFSPAVSISASFFYWQNVFSVFVAWLVSEKRSKQSNQPSGRDGKGY